MHRYETLFVQHPDTGEALARETSQKACKLIESMSGQINDVQEWGMRELAYPIAKQSRGIYVLVEYSATGDVVKELERTLRISDNVLRYVSVRQVQRKVVPPRVKPTPPPREAQIEVAPPAENQGN